ncbi:MAG: DUF5301 domain-containing protein [Clostridium sp.]
MSACGKVADPIELPNIDKIVSIKVSKGEQIYKEFIDKEDIKFIVNKILESKPTNKQAIQDSPNVDKTMIIEKLNDLIETSDRFICITKPRRFGKSSVADMLGAYYSKEVDSKDIFNKLNVSSISSYEQHLNKYNVINISLNELSDKGVTYDDYIEMIRTTLINDIEKNYPHVRKEDYFNINSMLRATKDKFIFIFDEWDYIFSNNLFEENHIDYLEFLRQLLKDQPYVSLAYMTGVLPIKKYSDGSSLNMFDEFTMLKDRVYDKYFGFTEDEVKLLCRKNDNISFEELEDWYNGYQTQKGDRIYNPRSVVKALQVGNCESFWTNTSAMDSVSNYLKYNTLEIREDVVNMVNGKEVEIFIKEEYSKI